MSAATRESFEARLRRVGEERYHHRHPFNVRMHEGRLTPDEIRAWVLNRYYYQTRIPRKDAVILAKTEDPGFRREWVRRLHDHDGREPGEGGLELWLRLGEAVGLDREELTSLRSVLPGVREACDDYVRLVESEDLLGCVAASLTELFAGPLMAQRIAAFEKHYPWVDPEGLHYFRTRTQAAPRDARFALAYVLDAARDEAAQERCIAALERKCAILWRLLDAVDAAFRRPRPSPHAQLRRDPEGGGWILVLPERLVRMNETGHAIFSLCDGRRSVQDLVTTLRARHPDAPDLVRDVHRFVAALEAQGALEAER